LGDEEDAFGPSGDWLWRLSLSSPTRTRSSVSRWSPETDFASPGLTRPTDREWEEAIERARFKRVDALKRLEPGARLLRSEDPEDWGRGVELLKSAAEIFEAAGHPDEGAYAALRAARGMRRLAEHAQDPDGRQRWVKRATKMLKEALRLDANKDAELQAAVDEEREALKALRA